MFTSVLKISYKELDEKFSICEKMSLRVFISDDIFHVCGTCINGKDVIFESKCETPQQVLHKIKNPSVVIFDSTKFVREMEQNRDKTMYVFLLHDPYLIHDAFVKFVSE